MSPVHITIKNVNGFETIFTINKKIIRKKIGKINEATIKKVKQELFKLI